MDTELLEGLSRGRQEAFDRLIREYYPRLMGYARLLLDEESARDIVQEVFLYVWEHRSRLHFTAGFQSYLFHICHSRMLDTIRRRKIFEVSDSPFDLQLREDAAWLERNNDNIVRRSATNSCWNASSPWRTNCPKNAGRYSVSRCCTT